MSLSLSFIVTWDDANELAHPRSSWRQRVAQCVFDTGWTQGSLCHKSANFRSLLVATDSVTAARSFGCVLIFASDAQCPRGVGYMSSRAQSAFVVGGFRAPSNAWFVGRSRVCFANDTDRISRFCNARGRAQHTTSRTTRSTVAIDLDMDRLITTLVVGLVIVTVYCTVCRRRTLTSYSVCKVSWRA